MAKCVGIEPTLRGLESLVLPLHQHNFSYFLGQHAQVPQCLYRPQLQIGYVIMSRRLDSNQRSLASKASGLPSFPTSCYEYSAGLDTHPSADSAPTCVCLTVFSYTRRDSNSQHSGSKPDVSTIGLLVHKTTRCRTRWLPDLHSRIYPQRHGDLVRPAETEGIEPSTVLPDDCFLDSLPPLA